MNRINDFKSTVSSVAGKSMGKIQLVTKIAFPLDHPVAIWHDIGIRSC